MRIPFAPATATSLPSRANATAFVVSPSVSRNLFCLTAESCHKLTGVLVLTNATTCPSGDQSRLTIPVPIATSRSFSLLMNSPRTTSYTNMCPLLPVEKAICLPCGAHAT